MDARVEKKDLLTFFGQVILAGASLPQQTLRLPNLVGDLCLSCAKSSDLGGHAAV